MIPPVLVRPEIMAGTGFLGAHADEVYRLEADDLYLVGTSEVPLAGYHADEILDLSDGPAALRRVVDVLPPRGGQLRQGHPRHHPRAPVRQGRGLRLLPAGRRRGRTPAAARLAARDAGTDRRAVSRDRRRRRRSRVLGGAQVRLRGMGADAADLSGADVDLELHHVSGAPAVDPLPRRERQAADRRDAQRDAGHDAVAGRDPGEPPAARRQRPRAGGAGAVRRDRRARADGVKQSSSSSSISTKLGRVARRERRAAAGCPARRA